MKRERWEIERDRDRDAAFKVYAAELAANERRARQHRESMPTVHLARRGGTVACGAKGERASSPFPLKVNCLKCWKSIH